MRRGEARESAEKRATQCITARRTVTTRVTLAGAIARVDARERECASTYARAHRVHAPRSSARAPGR
jgi:hypothetical protein